MSETLQGWAEGRGFLVAWGPGGRLLAQVRDDIGRRIGSGEVDPAVGTGRIDPAFAAENLAFDYDCHGLVDPVVLVVAMPRPAHRVRFLLNGARVDALMPPTYQRYRPTFEDVRGELERDVLPGHRVETLQAPLKLLAARLGLVRYGRNNVTYAPGLGSYLQLLGYVTDAPLPVPAGWTPAEPALMDECEGCGVCAALCPTGAIGEDRVLLRVERCLTLANESPGPWPSHVPPGAHHCLVGCLSCQQQCPANPPLAIVDSGIVFDDEQTRALLDEGDRTAAAWEGIRANLLALGQPYQEAVIGRNLRAFLHDGPA